jgi:hypothetical protein
VKRRSAREWKIILTHVGRVPASRLLGRLIHTINLKRDRFVDIRAFRLPADKGDWTSIAAVVTPEIVAWRVALSRSQGSRPDEEVQIRGRLWSLQQLSSIDWKGLGRGSELDLNQHYEISYLGWLLVLPSAIQQAVHCIREINHLGERGAWVDMLAWTPISVSNRLINLVALIECGRQAGAAEAIRTLLDHGDVCCGFLERRLETHLGYNHLVFNIVATLLWRAATNRSLPRRALRMLRRTLAEQILPDGGHAERSPTYHVHVLTLIILAQQLRLPPDLSEFLDDVVTRMRGALAIMSHPDGDIGLFSDSALHDAPPARLVSREHDKAKGVHLLPDFGLAKLCSGKDALLMDCGALGAFNNPGHGHADFLSCEVSLEGERFLIDPGTASYKAGPVRDATRSCHGHNGPCYDGRDLAEFCGAFTIGLSSRVHLGEVTSNTVTAICRPYFDAAAALQRRVEISRTGFMIEDAWTRAENLRPSSTYIVGPSWRIVSRTATEIEFASTVSGRRATVLAVAGEVDQVSPTVAYLRGPGLGESCTSIVFRPLLLPDRSELKVEVIGDRDKVVRSNGSAELVKSPE